MIQLSAVPEKVRRLARQARAVTVLSGAGMSAESGVPTFRDAQTGLWARFDATALATRQAWAADHDVVWAWYMWRVALVRRVTPNAGHRALARWAERPGTNLTIATQNVDDLHERAGSTVAAHVHGSLFAFRCDTCGTPYHGPVDAPDDPVERLAPPRCAHAPACPGWIRPGVVWFGEALPPDAFDAAVDAATTADLVLVVGTSGLIHPAAGLPTLARRRGVPVVEVNPDPTAISDVADHVWRSTAAVALPALVDSLDEASG